MVLGTPLVNVKSGIWPARYVANPDEQVAWDGFEPARHNTRKAAVKKLLHGPPRT
jgi:hypothetical protein